MNLSQGDRVAQWLARKLRVPSWPEIFLSMSTSFYPAMYGKYDLNYKIHIFFKTHEVIAPRFDVKTYHPGHLGAWMAFMVLAS